MRFKHGDYTVAWICALPLEMAAAKTMLDKIHSPLPQPKTDHNAYTLGNVAGHNVVVACLPSGVYGTTSAAIVLAHMLPTFPSLRFGLMVGIGGGVSSKKADIRLGDVVVSIPAAGSGGVIPYDYGKTLRDGYLQRTGSLNKPPPYLLTAVSQIRSDSHFEKGISEMLQKQQISRPDQDWLFKPDYHHESTFTNCSACDQSQLVIRPTRTTNEPVIHYGLIASGNQVMKAAKTRDSIAKELDILCFEMEAAGLMDQLPCLVIRGICDYCDSHKNEEWQGYAALTAAAYTAALLAVVPITMINAQPDQKTEFTAEEKACLHDLFLTDPADDRKALERRKGHRAPGTCSWILETDELKNWLQIGENGAQKESNIFWLYGNPGTGKSTMAITLTEELPNQAGFLGGKKRLAYFFCDSGSEHQRTAISILRGLLYQLITQHKSLMKYLLPKYTERRAKLFTSFDALWSVLMDMGQDPSISGTYCIVDAQDECEPDDQWIILHEIDQTFSNSKPQYSSSNAMHFLITSRPYPEIRRYLSSFSHRDLSAYPAVTTDLKTMIQEKVAWLSRQNNYPRPLMTEISQILEQRAEGTFLWVGIACGELRRVQARKALKTLQHLPKGLYFLYQKLFDTAITQCDEDDKPVILELVRFVAIAQRPFTIPELFEACELHPDDDEASRILFTRELIDSCGFIIIADDRVVRLLHGSVRDFLKDAAQVDELKSHAALAERCIASILKHYRSQANGKTLVSENAFLDYSVSFWPIHAGLAKGEFMVQAEQAAFFQLGSTVWTKWLGHYNSFEKGILVLDTGFSIFHAAARWGIDRLISWGCDDSNDGVLIDRDFRTPNGVTPLEEGARHGKIYTVGTLLSYMSEKEIIHQRVIEAAARTSENGRDIMALLLERRGDQIQITEDVVKAAARNWSSGEDIIILLLEQRGDQIQITEDVVKAAADNWISGKDIMALLLDRQGDQVHLTKKVVATIIKQFDKSVVALLIDQQAYQIQITEDILKAAAGNERSGKDIMTLLLEQRGDQIQITEGVVKAAADNWRSGKDIIALLLEQCEDQIQITEDVVKAAAGNRSSGEDIIILLLKQQGKQIHITEGILKAAAGNESSGKDIITLLLKQREDQIHITEGILKAAAGNKSSGKDIITLLLKQRGDQIQITEGVVKAAADIGEVEKIS
ncbi:vegetative incompatibility protein HET-E-1 [Aspergillus udagawae]|uniref:Vegetative incompatibility protein HET-E-1 n=1 Tax=Aspergillus udagawae TaxID=91492 RepID=A0ABQ1A881_9EURO|nr:vegetative incompatibility protein HET-E-1 [Aspergillus udagawae]